MSYRSEVNWTAFKPVNCALVRGGNLGRGQLVQKRRGEAADLNRREAFALRGAERLKACRAESRQTGRRQSRHLRGCQFKRQGSARAPPHWSSPAH